MIVALVIVAVLVLASILATDSRDGRDWRWQAPDDRGGLRPQSCG